MPEFTYQVPHRDLWLRIVTLPSTPSQDHPPASKAFAPSVKSPENNFLMYCLKYQA